MIRVGIIGWGGIARAHFDDYYAGSSVTGVQLVGIAEPDAVRREQFVGYSGIPNAYSSVEELLARGNLDVVDICTPPHTHPDLIRVAADANCAIICEKPLANDFEDAKSAVAYAEQRHIALGVMQNYRYRPEYEEAQKLVARGAIGVPFLITLEAFYHWDGGTNYRQLTEHMLILEQTYHYIDLFRYLLGDNIASVYALAGRLPTSQARGETWATITLKFERGAVGTITNSGECHGFVSNWGGCAVIQGSRGTIQINREALFSLKSYLVGNGGSVPRIDFPRDKYNANTNARFTEPLRTFYESIIEQRPVPVSGKDNLNTLAAALAAYESVRTNTVVHLS